RAAAERAARGREDRRLGVVFLHEVLQPQQIRPGGGENGRAVGRGFAALESGPGRAGLRDKTPAVVARVRVLEQRPFAGGGGESAFRIHLHAAGRVGGAERGPVEAEIRADAGVAGDAQVVTEQEIV